MDKPPSPIKEAAVRLDDGIIHTGRRHGGIILQMIEENPSCGRIMQIHQGFIDEDGIFLNREEAYNRAVEWCSVQEL